ncbi:NDP-sugar synthase [Gemmatimonadota bacterium]
MGGTTLWAMNPTLVILAAGMSTRYGRLKQLEPVGPSGEALLDYAVFDARMAGFSRVVFIIRPELEEDFRNHFPSGTPPDLDVVFHHQRVEDLPCLGSLGGVQGQVEIDPGTRTKPWGTAHALLTARPHLSGPFVVLNADDFYGRSAFVQAASWLNETGAAHPPDRPVFGLVAYTLDETLSPHGGVSRAVCRGDLEGWLEEIEEVLNIHRADGEIRGRTVDGTEVVLPGQEVISTGFWIFTPAIFSSLEEGFRRFFAGAPGATEDAEFLIPAEVCRLLRDEVIRVWVLRARDPFFGITHPRDWEWVSEKIGELVENGTYPSPLWGAES